VFYKAVPTH